jgi:hypothetical protein
VSPLVSIPPQTHMQFDPYTAETTIRVQRDQWIGGAQFVVYSATATLGKGSCPALTARPPYVPVKIPANTPFTVQNVSPTVTIEVTY